MSFFNVNGRRVDQEAVEAGILEEAYRLFDRARQNVPSYSIIHRYCPEDREARINFVYNYLREMVVLEGVGI